MNKIVKTRDIHGFTRSDDEGKVNYALIPISMLHRVGRLYTDGAAVHGKNNWKEGKGPEVMESARESAFRHFIAWMEGKEDEDHYAALIWNLNLYENAKED